MENGAQEGEGGRGGRTGKEGGETKKGESEAAPSMGPCLRVLLVVQRFLMGSWRGRVMGDNLLVPLF
eukprot:1426298-Pyramimonas_sp.AAC.1